MLWIFWIILAFFLGSLPFGLIVAKVSKGLDPRRDGSGNTGATNVARLCGTGYGVLVLVLDILKGFLPLLMASHYSSNWFFITLCGLAAILGHIYSPFLNWKGGKAVAVTIGVFLAVAFWATVLSAAACLAVIAASGFVSMGSLTLALALPVFCLLTLHIGTVPLALIASAILLVRHRENVLRLARGEEKPWRKHSA
ncbi:MAG: acyl phosphate:glycerol-3-phosphate acyltransferase [Desulfovibrionales bacterium]|nr:acyl phosphate:glycerol-3-phosphate acyltransferase [Desulfovibrionales bacterium]